MISKNYKRVFIALKVFSNWKDNQVKGRIIDRKWRHITLAFLGQTEISKLLKFVEEIPAIWDLEIPIFGYFNKLLLLPPFKARVLGLNPLFFENTEKIFTFQQTLTNELAQVGLLNQKSVNWLPHVSLVRAPFNYLSYSKHFFNFPFYCESIVIYESLGHLKYKELLSYPLKEPFTISETENSILIKAFGLKSEQLNFSLYLGLIKFSGLNLHLNIDFFSIDDQRFHELISTLLIDSDFSFTIDQQYDKKTIILKKL
jgi:2'-5' RNA ligase